MIAAAFPESLISFPETVKSPSICRLPTSSIFTTSTSPPLTNWKLLSPLLSSSTLNIKLVSEDKMRYRETITKGFENAPQALRDVLTGKNFGKQIIEI